MEKIVKKIEDIENPIDNIFKDNVDKKKRSIGLIHRAYLTQIKNSRKYLASTKTKSEVRGGGKKPWKQKGTGNARAGSSRSPLWKGGGVSFGPKPRTVNKKINKKERRLAVLSALYLKKQQFIFVDDSSFKTNENVKTKTVTKLLSDLGLKNNEKILFILTEPNKQFWLASRNLKNVEVTAANCLNIKQLLSTNHIILSNASLDSINSTYGKQYA
jgi:large subunit ribosomal protein L4|tara:strand:- start:91 stop:735 length:645 start_codon:yes stop_codon:yes gene_type:complete